jgi:hypothetical protein
MIRAVSRGVPQSAHAQSFDFADIVFNPLAVFRKL